VLLARGYAANKIAVIPNTMVFPPELHASAQPTPVIVTHATLVERYGVHVAIAAFQDVRQDWPDLQMLILGEGEQLPALRELVAQLGIADVVEFPGYLPWFAAMSRISACAVGVVPVLDDGYGRFMVPTKLYDYILLGIPAACSRLPAIEDYFPPDAVAYFEPGDVRGLAACMRRLLSDPAAASRQVAAATRAIAPLKWETVCVQYLGLLGVAPATPAADAPAQLASGSRRNP
jgi:glycosyltransferase involved in cell wall biosynthesis